MVATNEMTKILINVKSNHWADRAKLLNAASNATALHGSETWGLLQTETSENARQIPQIHTKKSQKQSEPYAKNRNLNESYSITCLDESPKLVLKKINHERKSIA